MVASVGRMERPLVSRRGFYFGLSLFMVALVVWGFGPSAYAVFFGDAPMPARYVHVHALVFYGWLALFVIQTGFVANGHINLHRRLGRIGIGWGFAVWIIGLITTALTFDRMVTAEQIEEVRRFIVWPLLDMMIFPLFFILAVVYRHTPDLHKRLMVVAMTSLLSAAVFRAVGFATPMTHFLSVLLWLSPILLAMTYDHRRTHSVHSVYVAGSVLLAISSFRELLTTTRPWLEFVGWLAD